MALFGQDTSQDSPQESPQPPWHTSRKTRLNQTQTLPLTSACSPKTLDPLLAQSADREEALSQALLLGLALGLALCEYLVAQPWPMGHWFFCRLPYAVAVVQYKAVAIPLWVLLAMAVRSAGFRGHLLPRLGARAAVWFAASVPPSSFVSRPKRGECTALASSHPSSCPRSSPALVLGRYTTLEATFGFGPASAPAGEARDRYGGRQRAKPKKKKDRANKSSLYAADEEEDDEDYGSESGSDPSESGGSGAEEEEAAWGGLARVRLALALFWVGRVSLPP